MLVAHALVELRLRGAIATTLVLEAPLQVVDGAQHTSKNMGIQRAHYSRLVVRHPIAYDRGSMHSEKICLLRCIENQLACRLVQNDRLLDVFDGVADHFAVILDREIDGHQYAHQHSTKSSPSARRVAGHELAQ